MNSANAMAMVPVLALAGVANGQEKADEQRIGELIKKLRSDTTWDIAAEELLELGDAVPPLLVEAIWKMANRSRGGSVYARALARFGEKAAYLVPPLVEEAQGSGKRTPAGIFLAIGWLGSYLNAEQRAEIGARLRSIPPNNGLFTTAAYVASRGVAQAHLELGATPSAEACVRGLEHENPFFRMASAEKLADQSFLRRSVDAATRAALYAALEAEHPKRVILQDSTFRVDVDVEIRRQAGIALLLVGERGARMAPAYRLCLRDWWEMHPRIRRLAVPEYRRCMLDWREGIKGDAILAIGAMGGEGSELVSDLVRMTSDRNAMVVREAITALGMIGPAARDAIPTLEMFSEHADSQIAERAKAALKQIRGDG